MTKIILFKKYYKQIIFVIIAWIVFSFLQINYLIDRNHNDDNTTRINLLKLKNSKSGLSSFNSDKSIRYFGTIFDFELDNNYKDKMPLSHLVRESMDGIFLASWRFNVIETSSVSFVILSKSQNHNYSINIIDSYGRKVFYKSSLINIPKQSALLQPGIYRCFIQANFTLDNIIINSTKLNNNNITNINNSRKIPLVDLNIDIPNHRKFDYLINASNNHNNSSIINTPNLRVDGLLRGGENKEYVKIKIGLSGRTREHLQYFPSTDIHLSANSTLFGMNDFKLYRPSTKNYFHEMVYLSLLKDLGFLVPRQTLIDLHVNGESHGIYYIVENPSEPYFLELEKSPGIVAGFDINNIFFDYPYSGVLKPRMFYDNYSRTTRNLNDYPKLYDKNIINNINKDLMAKLIAFSSIYLSVHGLGIDDLRFYQDPMTGIIEPIPRDLAPNAWGNSVKPIKSFRSHFYWLNNQSEYTIWPVRKIYDSNWKFNRKVNIFDKINSADMSSGVSDVHPMVLAFLEKSENLSLVNKYVKYFAKNRFLSEILHRRLINIYDDAFKVSSDPLYDKIKTKVKNNNLVSLGDLALSNIVEKPPIINHSNKSYLWNARSSIKLDPTLIPSFTSPVIINKEDKNNYSKLMKAGFIVEKTIFDLLKNKNIYLKNKTYKSVISENSKQYDYINNNKIISNEDNNNYRKNIICYLGELNDSMNKYIVFIVRNATKDFNLTLKFRDGRRSLEKIIDELIIPDESPVSYANDNQIVKNHYLLSEPKHYYVFKIKQSKYPIFVEINPDSGGWSYGTPVNYYISENINDYNGKENHIHEYISIEDEFYKIYNNKINYINEPVFIPSGKSLIINEGSRLIFGIDGGLHIEGDLIIEGTKNLPVIFEAQNIYIPWKGIYVKGQSNNRSQVKITHARFKNIGNYPIGSMFDKKFTGSITLINSDASIDNVIIENSSSEDAINAIKSSLLIQNTNVIKSYSDGIDLDFCNANIINSKFIDSKGDGLDISNSLIVLNDSEFYNNGDKGLSIGEKSYAEIVNCKFINNNIGIANKDQSLVSAIDSYFNNNIIAVASYIKKPYFGKPILESNNNKYTSNINDYKWLGFYDY